MSISRTAFVVLLVLYVVLSGFLFGVITLGRQLNASHYPRSLSRAEFEAKARFAPLPAGEAEGRAFELETDDAVIRGRDGSDPANSPPPFGREVELKLSSTLRGAAVALLVPAGVLWLPALLVAWRGSRRGSPTEGLPGRLLLRRAALMLLLAMLAFYLSMIACVQVVERG